ncbi:hypothetical protein JCM16418_4998 [Paenibacillus pini JCM 16418]|uniref:Uncharacterized protein n=1 Tax=Paenibacillus pini JCM 16418 TaxID=1236976 RepID=W7YU86_9BACL|nr:hypothetical protein JCM16418_4998 [Paenibacillus pini JCM 16418]
MFSETAKKITLLTIKQAQGEINSEKMGKEFLKDGCIQWIAAVLLIIVEIVYLVNAIGYDTYKFPTLIMIALLISLLIIGSMEKNVNKMTDLELAVAKAKASRSKNVTLISIIRGLIWITYYGYMLYILVFDERYIPY